MMLRGHKVIGGKVEGEALVLPDPFSFFGGIVPETGVLTSGPCAGQSLRDKVLVFPRGKGSTLAPYVAYRAFSAGVAPKAILCRDVDGVVATVSIITGIPTIDRLDPDPVTSIKTGDHVKVDADSATVEVIAQVSVRPGA